MNDLPSEKDNESTNQDDQDDELEQFLSPIAFGPTHEPPPQNRPHRRRLYLDPQVLWDKCKEYFDKCDEDGLAYTVPELAYYLGFISRQAIFHYEKRGDDCAKVIKAAKLKIEGQRNRQLVEGQGYMAGRIFDLKCNFGYNDAALSSDDPQKEGKTLVQQNNFYGLPPKPQTLEEWTKWYQTEMKQGQKQQSIEEDSQDSGRVIDVSKDTKEALEDEGD